MVYKVLTYYGVHDLTPVYFRSGNKVLRSHCCLEQNRKHARAISGQQLVRLSIEAGISLYKGTQTYKHLILRKNQKLTNTPHLLVKK